MVLGLLLAHAAQGGGKTAKALRAIYLFPQAISLVVVAIIWQFLYNPSFGLVDSAAKQAHLPIPSSGWLGDPHTALPAVTVAFIWYVLGFYIMLFAAGIKNIPEDVLEAAHLDGADGFRRFRMVTWPLLWSVKRVAVTYIAINVLNVFALVQVMTAGGPDRRTDTILTYLYEAGFQHTQLGYASTVAASNFVVAMVISLFILWLFRRNPEASRA
jgi:N-acetylglucosamine transport system permease protein